ncbi:hypothetical protein Pst134EA_017279 [Puccinia striiformis f. sp. tritici]|uniref:hypothetical protein n=1 Tax=Puccinia striiformis f. sp. tritici TaxID=168172 RepID=UPI0020082729|nr:hypothetical protein Pst134EA_017279 [Puccinia striiformis f. sp. tritici]KAH9450672.1 hypothetical protein Pst134EB_018198 [Puccinia striiformis f. sp. tritici]KAH9460971.1 hypothetical protein Pst134EA_017279 [Puccinia striiformis f. sp. tritici]KAI9622480.1 hypothetical protein H4Q26_015161 [Puccinia striiformis f. sp. tritici PST-130]
MAKQEKGFKAALRAQPTIREALAPNLVTMNAAHPIILRDCRQQAEIVLLLSNFTFPPKKSPPGSTTTHLCQRPRSILKTVVD